LLVLITGGVASGKSEIAERMSVSINSGKMAYIATMKADDEECRKRVVKHRKMRETKGFATFEVPYNLSFHIDKFKGYDTGLLECLSNLTANEMFLAGRSGRETFKEICAAIKQLDREVGKLVIVSSTILAGINAYDQFTEEYIQVLGQINCEIAAEADVVVEAVCSLPVIHKGKKEIGNENFF